MLFKPSEDYLFPELDEFMGSLFSEFPTIQIDILELDYKEGVQQLVDSGVKVVIMGTRSTDPDGRLLRGIFSDSSRGWPRFTRFCPVLFWSYTQVWEFIRGNNLPYCSLYDKGYTSIGSILNTSPNPRLILSDGSYLPAYKLEDGKYERLGRCLSRRGSRENE